MNRWVGKIAVVTGASAGIGAQIAVDLAKAGVITVGLARRAERVEELKKDLLDEFKKNLIARKCDVSSEDEINSTFQWIEKTYGGIDILVNNAGIYRPTKIVKAGNTKDITDIINVNLLAPVYCIREAFRTMKTRGNPGHIIIISSVAGHSVPYFVTGPTGSMNIYPPSKYAITALSEVVRQELLMEKTKIKITSISPGAVKTEIAGDPDAFNHLPHLLPEDISEAVLYVLGTPERVQVHELTIKPIGEAF